MVISLANAHSPRYTSALVWLRRDLRAHDHAALYHALKNCGQVFVCFVFDSDVIAALPRVDRRVEFIVSSLADVNTALQQMAQAAALPHAAQVQLLVRHGSARELIPKLAATLGVQAVFANQEYEPAAIARDSQVRGSLANVGITLHLFKDQVIFDAAEVLTPAGRAYSAFSAYQRAWLQKISTFYLQAYPCERYAQQLAAPPAIMRTSLPSLQDLDFQPSNLAQLRIPTGTSGAAQMLAHFWPRLARYAEDRHYPARRGVSYLSVHLRFGTLSIRQVLKPAWEQAQSGHEGAKVWLSELIRRDFFTQILARNPRLAQGKSYRPEYDAMVWEKGARARKIFTAWCEGKTGYPLIDAAMRQLNYSGYMHNRLRMVTASFLCKHLGVDWRWGEAYFAEKLNDFDYAANNGGWQWAAGSGCDAQPYFRILNPVLQSQKLDPSGQFILRYVPELAALGLPHLHAPWQADALELQVCGLRLGSKAQDHYPLPIVEHRAAVEKAQQRYAVVKRAS